MINLDDLVRVTSSTKVNGVDMELIKIGTICRVVSIDIINNNERVIGIIPEHELLFSVPSTYQYLEDELEKGHMEWVKDE